MIGIVDHFTTVFAPKLISSFFDLRRRNVVISKPDHCTERPSPALPSAYKQLLDEVFVISRIIEVEVGVISRSRRLRLIKLTEADYSGYHKNGI